LTPNDPSQALSPDDIAKCARAGCSWCHGTGYVVKHLQPVVAKPGESKRVRVPLRSERNGERRKVLDLCACAVRRYAKRHPPARQSSEPAVVAKTDEVVVVDEAPQQ
jgi:hypothetical protein